MAGMDHQTGRPLSGVGHVRQSIQIILSTPIGSRVGRRLFGSALFDLIDQPVTEAWALEVVAATAEALLRWEPRFRLESVTLNQPEPGRIILNISGEYLPGGQPLTIDGIVIDGSNNNTGLSVTEDI